MWYIKRLSFLVFLCYILNFISSIVYLDDISKVLQSKKIRYAHYNPSFEDNTFYPNNLYLKRGVKVYYKGKEVNIVFFKYFNEKSKSKVMRQIRDFKINKMLPDENFNYKYLFIVKNKTIGYIESPDCCFQYGVELYQLLKEKKVIESASSTGGNDNDSYKLAPMGGVLSASTLDGSEIKPTLRELGNSNVFNNAEVEGITRELKKEIRDGTFTYTNNIRAEIFVDDFSSFNFLAGWSVDITLIMSNEEVYQNISQKESSELSSGKNTDKGIDIKGVGGKEARSRANTLNKESQMEAVIMRADAHFRIEVSYWSMTPYSSIKSYTLNPVMAVYVGEIFYQTVYP